MTKYEEIILIESQIKELEAKLSKLRSSPKKKIKRGDYVIATATQEWSYTKGERYWVDSVGIGHIKVRSANPADRNRFIFWMDDSDWIKE